MMINSRDYLAFLAIVEHGSLGRAATALNVTQPALSRTIQQLERKLKAPLYDRTSRGMSLTIYGQALLPHAKLMANENAHVVEEIAELRGGGRGVLRIGTLGSLATSYLPLVLADVLRQLPGLRVHLEDGVEDDLVRSLLSGSVDVVLCNRLLVHDDLKVVGNCAFTDEFTVVAASDHPLHACPAPSLEAALDEEWALSPKRTPPRIAFEKRLAELSRPIPRVAVEGLSPMLIKAMVRHARLLTWLPTPLFAAEEAAGWLKRLTVPDLIVQRTFVIYARQRGILHPAAETVVAALKNPAGRQTADAWR